MQARKRESQNIEVIKEKYCAICYFLEQSKSCCYLFQNE